MVLPKFGLLVVRPCPAEALAALTLVAGHLVLSTQGIRCTVMYVSLMARHGYLNLRS